MQIMIDTKHDSHEEIKKIIKMLSSLVGDQEIFINQNPMVEEPIEIPSEGKAAESDTAVDPTPDLMNIFVDQKKTESKQVKKAEDDLGIPLLEEYHD